MKHGAVSGSELRISERLGYSFAQPELLRRALTHRSHNANNNERLEFLGDSVLNCLIADALYQQFPRLSEGELSRLRASLVNQQTLYEVAQSLNLGEHVLLGEGELKSGGFRRPSILADALEAVLAAVFLDGGFARVQQVVHDLFAPLLRGLDPGAILKDPKTVLQEYLQARRIALPQYSVRATRGEAHEQEFQVECTIAELNVQAVGEGMSRRSAEQNAARLAYQLAARP
ncbi:MAG: ribonuclease III [Burkholderiales bacterium]|nr:ribonuclease III [Burkholderiales bacterium]